MSRNISRLKWQCVSESVRGASHLRASLPNQDAIKLYPESGRGLPAILAVSDGHGSAKSFRSHRGSLMAVEIAVEVMKEIFLNSSLRERDFATLESVANRLLPKRIAREWKKAVNRDLGLLENCPINSKDLAYRPNFTDEEYQILIQKEGAKAWQAVEDNHFLAYGATLLAVLVTERFIVYLQLGDGDILQVDAQGNTTRPMTQDSRLIANQTTSLCMVRAEDEFQVYVERYPRSTQKQMPALILAATDGYANSFSTDEGFSRIGQDYRQMFKESLAEDIRQQLKAILEETSERGSGDDITLGVMKRLEQDDQDALKPWMKPLQSRVMFPNKNRKADRRRQENISGAERKDEQFAIAHKSNHSEKGREKFIIIGLTIALALALVYIALSSYFFPCAIRVESASSFLRSLLRAISNMKK